MAVTADQLIQYRKDCIRCKGSVAASTTLYAGTVCFIDTGGDRASTTNTGGNSFGGFVVDQLDNSSGADGDIDGEFVMSGHVVVDQGAASLTKADVGAPIYASDNYTFTTTSTNNVLIGYLREVNGSDITIKLTNVTAAAA